MRDTELSLDLAAELEGKQSRAKRLVSHLRLTEQFPPNRTREVRAIDLHVGRHDSETGPPTR